MATAGLYQAAVLRQPRIIEIAPQRFENLAESEVRLQIEYAGICGTDLSIFQGDYPVPMPLVLGHEFSGIVTECGAAVSGNWIGKRVVCEINNSCIAYRSKKLCAACERGLATHCLERSVTGIINHSGAFAQYLTVPAGNLHLLPDEIPSDTAIFVEPLAAAIRTFELCKVQPGQTVVILGAGRLGRLIALVAHKMGARVIAVARSSHSLERAALYAWKLVQLQAEVEELPQSTSTVSPAIHPARNHTELREIILGFTEGLGADVVVEATGVNRNINLALQLVRPLGALCLKSTSGVPVANLPATEAIVNEVQIHTSRCGPFDTAIHFMLEHGLPDSSWISSVYDLPQIAAAIQSASTEPKVLLRCQSP